MATLPEHLGPDNAAFLTLLVLASMRESFRHASPEEGGRHSGSALKHVTLIEEAHNLVGFTGPAPSDDSANPRYHAAQFVARMLAEVRALGEGLIIVDQLPSAVAPEVVKNTGIKYAGRLVSGDDRETMAAAMMLDPAQTDELARLGVGDAYLYHERFHAPRRCAGLDAYSYLELAGAPGDSELIDLQERVYGSGIREVLSERSWFLDHGRLLANELDEEVNIALEQILKIVVASMGDGPGLTAPVLRVKLERTYQQLYARVEALLARGGLREDDLELVHSAFLRLNGGISKSLAIVKQLEEDGAPGGEP